MNVIVENRIAQVSAYKLEQRKNLFKAYYLVIADIFSNTPDATKHIEPSSTQYITAQRLQSQIELIR
ncbi:hypothetical protein CCP3SC1AL1_1620008 [Gammaproteobacteria bacterium]